MEENNKRRPGRPTDKRKDTILRLRIDSDTHALLLAYAKANNVSMSEIVREAINKIVEEER
jgi:predicted HicB family RNase H-like nuclease